MRKKDQAYRSPLSRRLFLGALLEKARQRGQSYERAAAGLIAQVSSLASAAAV